MSKKMKGSLVSAVIIGMVIIFFAITIHMMMSEVLTVVFNATSAITSNNTAIQAMSRNVEIFNMMPLIIFIIVILAWIVIAQRRSELDQV